MPTQEFLHGFDSSLLNGISWQEMVEKGLVISPGVLRQVLIQAHNVLISTPGPNLARRMSLAHNWLWWWVGYLSNIPSGPQVLTPSSRVAPIPVLNKLFTPWEEKPTSGIIFGGFEGTPGHRWAADWMITHVHWPAVGLEQDPYLQKKGKDRTIPAPGSKNIDVGPLWYVCNCYSSKTG
jgi:hypothetical protein